MSTDSNTIYMTDASLAFWLINTKVGEKSTIDSVYHVAVFSIYVHNFLCIISVPKVITTYKTAVVFKMSAPDLNKASTKTK